MARPSTSRQVGSLPIRERERIAASLRLIQATVVTIVAALKAQACDQDEEYAAVLEHHVMRRLDTVLGDLEPGNEVR